MRRRVRARASFAADVEAQVRWLREHGAVTDLSGLRAGIREARTLLRRFPSAGPLEREARKASLRKLILRRVPYVIWYVDDGAGLWLLRLFHVRQDR